MLLDVKLLIGTVYCSKIRTSRRFSYSSIIAIWMRQCLQLLFAYATYAWHTRRNI